MTEFSFTLEATDGTARTGVISTPRGRIRTPAFMPVGTAGTVKAMLPESVAATGADILLGNTYHLMLRPTAERIDRLGGLHRFMNWDRPILTDSGGFQVMSLAGLRKLTERGVTFKSHIDGSKHELTPERSMEIQRLLGSDIVMCFDECPALPASEAEVARAMRLSMRWAERSRAAFGQSCVFQLGQPLRQQRCRNTGHAPVDVVEAAAAVDQPADHQDGPALAEDLGGKREGTVLTVAARHAAIILPTVPVEQLRNLGLLQIIQYRPRPAGRILPWPACDGRLPTSPHGRRTQCSMVPPWISSRRNCVAS